MHTELDGGEYPTGIRISDEAIAALPITRHRFHGDWNYTFHPAGHQPRPDLPHQRGWPADGRHPLPLHDLQHPELTGMPRKQLSDLTHTLIPRLEGHREQARRTARGGPRRVTPGTGRKPVLTPEILITILYLRKHALLELLGQLFNTTAMTISRAAKGPPAPRSPRRLHPSLNGPLPHTSRHHPIPRPRRNQDQTNVLVPGKP